MIISEIKLFELKIGQLILALFIALVGAMAAIIKLMIN